MKTAPKSASPNFYAAYLKRETQLAQRVRIVMVMHGMMAQKSPLPTKLTHFFRMGLPPFLQGESRFRLCLFLRHFSSLFKIFHRGLMREKGPRLRRDESAEACAFRNHDPHREFQNSYISSFLGCIANKTLQFFARYLSNEFAKRPCRSSSRMIHIPQVRVLRSHNTPARYSADLLNTSYPRRADRLRVGLIVDLILCYSKQFSEAHREL
jgi:hypothetical protein